MFCDRKGHKECWGISRTWVNLLNLIFGRPKTWSLWSTGLCPGVSGFPLPSSTKGTLYKLNFTARQSKMASGQKRCRLKIYIISVTHNGQGHPLHVCGQLPLDCGQCKFPGEVTCGPSCQPIASCQIGSEGLLFYRQVTSVPIIAKWLPKAILSRWHVPVAAKLLPNPWHVTFVANRWQKQVPPSYFWRKSLSVQVQVWVSAHLELAPDSVALHCFLSLDQPSHKLLFFPSWHIFGHQVNASSLETYLHNVVTEIQSCSK